MQEERRGARNHEVEVWSSDKSLKLPVLTVVNVDGMLNAYVSPLLFFLQFHSCFHCTVNFEPLTNATALAGL